MSDWITAGPLPSDCAEEQLWKVWRECEDGIIEGGIYSHYPLEPSAGFVLVELFVRSVDRSWVSTGRLRKMLKPPQPKIKAMQKRRRK